MLRRRSSLWLALALVHCGPPAQPVTSQPGPVMPPDLKPVMERFAPTQVPLGQAFGVSGFGGDSVPGAPPSTELDALASLHAGILRRDFTWSRIEPQPGTFDYSADDQAVEALSQQGVALLGILDYSAKWSIANGDEHAAPDPALFAAYAKSV